MALRIAIVGPGRVGTAFARGFVDAGSDLLGFVGRDSRRTQACVAAVGCGSVLGWEDLSTAHIVVFAVGDGDLAECVQAASSVGGRRYSLWLHTSGRHGLDVFAPAIPLGARIGSLHPLLPFSGSAAETVMSGGLALLAGEPRSMRLLLRICSMLKMHPITSGEQNRVLYHAACALAANGATALFSVVGDLLRRAGGLGDQDAGRIVSELMQSAVLASSRHSAAVALSGPVRRGDDATVRAHLDELQKEAPSAVPSYVALMQQAVTLAREQGLPPSDCARIQSALLMLRPSP